MKIWNALRTPPKEALKTIGAGRLKGMSDINPQWRYMALTEQFGPCGIGWKFEITRTWTFQGSEDQVCAFAEVLLYIKVDGEWSAPIPGIGGSMLVTKESKGLHTSDEAYKMAVTDALGTAAKMLGLAADVYLNNMDGSKYRKTESDDKPELITETEASKIHVLLEETSSNVEMFLKYMNVAAVEEIQKSQLKKAMTALNSKLEKK